MDAYHAYRQHDLDGDAPSFSAELSTRADEHTPEFKMPRSSERVPVEFGAGLRQRGASGVSVQLIDLSTHGFRVATHLELAVGTDVWLRLPRLEACHAKVAWCEGHYVGCAFVHPLHPAVLQMIVANPRA